MTEERFLRVNKKSREALFALNSQIQWFPIYVFRRYLRGT